MDQSGSDVVTPTIPVDYSVLKSYVRRGLSPASRDFWWPILPTINSMSRIVSDPDSVACAERLVGILKEPLLDMKNQVALLDTDELDPEAFETIYRNLTYVLVNTRKVEHNSLGLIEALLKLLLLQIRRIDVACYIASHILGEPNRFGRYDLKGSYAVQHTFCELLKVYCPKTHVVLNTMGALDSKYLDIMFSAFFVEILPPNMVFTLLDSYLLEGVKTLLRYALGLVFAYKSHIKAGRFQTAKDFWLSVKADATNYCNENSLTMLNKTLGLEEALPVVDTFIIYEIGCRAEVFVSSALLSYVYDKARSTLKKMARPMPISKQALLASYNKHVDSAPANAIHRKQSLSSSPKRRSGSVSLSEKLLEESGPSNKAQVLSRKGSVRRNSLSSNPSPVSGVSPSPEPDVKNHNSNIYSVVPDLALPSSGVSANLFSKESEPLPSSQPQPGGGLCSSSILPASRVDSFLDTILPSQFFSLHYKLCYASYEHGWDFSTLLSRLKDKKQVVLLLKLQAPYESTVIGACNNGPLQINDRGVVGDGATSRIFRINADSEITADNTDNISDASKVYSWIGLSEPEEYNQLVKLTEEGEVQRELLSALNQYCVVNREYISFGASIEHSCSAIRLSNTLDQVFVGPSETYSSPSLLSSSEEANSKVFTVGLKEIEVYALP